MCVCVEEADKLGDPKSGANSQGYVKQNGGQHHLRVRSILNTEQWCRLYPHNPTPHPDCCTKQGHKGTMTKHNHLFWLRGSSRATLRYSVMVYIRLDLCVGEERLYTHACTRFLFITSVQKVSLAVQVECMALKKHTPLTQKHCPCNFQSLIHH